MRKWQEKKKQSIAGNKADYTFSVISHLKIWYNWNIDIFVTHTDTNTDADSSFVLHPCHLL